MNTKIYYLKTNKDVLKEELLSIQCTRSKLGGNEVYQFCHPFLEKSMSTS